MATKSGVRSEAPRAAWWLPRRLQRFPPSHPPDPSRVASRIVPPCTARPSLITRRALETFDAELLHELLRLDDVSALAARRASEQPAERRRIAGWKREEKTWATVANALIAAIEAAPTANFRSLRSYSFPSSGALLPTAHYPVAFASPDVIDDERVPPWALHDDIPGRRIDLVEVDAVSVLTWVARNARDLENEAAEEIRKASELGRLSGADSRAVVRDRVSVLVGELQRAGWSLGDIADLIVASGADWTESPSTLSVTYQYDWKSEARRTEPKRVALADWLRDQARATLRRKVERRSRRSRADRRR